MVRESESPHSTPTFCVRNLNGKWRLVHAYNKLNNATVQAQTTISRKDVLLNNMSGCYAVQCPGSGRRILPDPDAGK
ncbi:Pol protein [Phytophthora palmivora]|uniref:Pol protein n=1 Tax=Phytophthora palmivora TaxID=4796 RepID=A0A2P4X711_9STRA|nr:Pol protein [Phytophthora palmivora]